MPPFSDKQVYQALTLPDNALDKGGIEILRAGVIEDELYVSARNAFKDPAQWGEVLADITRRLGELCAAEGEYKKKEVIAAIASAFAADLGAPVVREPKPAPTRRAAGRKARAPARKKPKVAKPRAKSRVKSRAKTSLRRKPRSKR